MRNICKIFHFWRPAKIFYCVLLLVVLLLFIVANQTQTYLYDYQPTSSRIHYDNSRQYIIQDSFFVGDEWPPTNDISGVVCLATQTSVENLHHVIDSAIRWKGPMSVAVFTPSVDHQIAVIYLQYLTKCFPNVMNNVSIHWVYPVEHPPEEMSDLYFESIEFHHCSKRKEVLKQLLDERPSSMISWRQVLVYPQNLVRNVARKSCVSEYVVLTDADIVPSPRMSQVLSSFVNTTQARLCDKCVFVIPTYETRKNSSLPGSKKELLDMVAQKKARSYRVVAYRPNQAATNVSAWEALPVKGSDVVSIAYPLPKFRFNYEPFYLSKDNVPPHDERFVGYGYTRNTQVYEMQMAGYSFFVLDNIFFIHPGMVSNPYSSSEFRRNQVRKNAKMLRKFMIELKMKYRHAQANLRKGRS